MPKKEADIAPKLRQALVAAAMEVNGDIEHADYLPALAMAVLAVVAIRANPGEEHRLMADFKKQIRLGIPDAIERKPQLTAEYKRRKK